MQSVTTVYYDPVQANAQLAAQQLRPLFGSHTVVKSMTPTISGFAARAGNPLTVVTVGTSFPGDAHDSEAAEGAAEDAAAGLERRGHDGAAATPGL